MPDRFLVQVLGQNEHIRQLIKQSAEELSSVNSGIRLKVGDPIPAPEIAFQNNEVVIRNLQEAFSGLTAMNQGLQIEIRKRIMLDHQLAAAVEQEEGARKAALHDSLTGLPNRVLFKIRLEHAIAQAERYQWTIAVMFVDLDNFKSINDRYGHQAGDAVLQTVAVRLKHNTREDDTVSRYGGDEFLCVLTQLHEQKDIAMIAAKLLIAIRAPCAMSVRDVIVNPCLGASVGIAIYPKDGGTASALIKSADEAMYGAKQTRSGYAFANKECAARMCGNALIGDATRD